MEADTYLKDGAARILELMKATFGDYFKAYFDGEPANIPEFYLPCIIIGETEGEISSGATGTDDIIETVTITLVLNKKDDLGASIDSDLTGFKLRKLVKGQNPSTSYPHEYIPQSVMYALRTQITLDDTVLSSTIRTVFGPNARLGGSDEEVIATEEAVVTLTLERMALVPSRE